MQPLFLAAVAYFMEVLKMNYKQLIVDSGLKMLKSGLTVETWGNISIRDSETGLVYITPSGMDYSTIVTDDVVVCATDGKIMEGTRKPSIETGLHLAVYRNRPEVNAVIHTHPIYTTAFSCIGENIPMMTDEAAQTMGGQSVTAEYALPGTEALAGNCVAALGKQSNSCLLKSHGAVCVGESMDGAFKVATVLEVTARIYWMVRSMNGVFEPISDENIAAMQEFVKYHYGQDK